MNHSGRDDIELSISGKIDDQARKRTMASEEKKLVVLISNGVSDRTQATNQDRTLTLLKAKKTPHVTIDGMNPDQRDIRNELFEVSGMRGNYPQLFFVFRDGSTTFLGGWEKIETINDASDLPADVLQGNPEIETWTSVFGGVVEKFEG